MRGTGASLQHQNALSASAANAPSGIENGTGACSLVALPPAAIAPPSLIAKGAGVGEGIGRGGKAGGCIEPGVGEGGMLRDCGRSARRLDRREAAAAAAESSDVGSGESPSPSAVDGWLDDRSMAGDPRGVDDAAADAEDEAAGGMGITPGKEGCTV